MRIYLAGPDVFLPDPAARAAALKAICTRHGLTGVSPLDGLDEEPTEWRALTEARRIALRNEAHIRGCNALIANLTPFRGPSADVGTVFEVGFMRALGRPVLGWTNDARPFEARTRLAMGVDPTISVDADGLLIEAFGLVDNLMIDGAIASSAGALFQRDVRQTERWTDLRAFEACVTATANLLLERAAENTQRRRHAELSR